MNIKDETTTIGKFTTLPRGKVFKVDGGWWYIKIGSIQDQWGRYYNAVCLDNGNIATLTDDDVILAVATEMVIR